MQDILLCRTPHLGGHIWWCEKCCEYHYSYHSCKNRHCPQCQNEQADEWLTKQSEKLLPVEYFMATFTLPEELRRLVRSHQRILYHLFFQAASQSLQILAKDPRFLGGEIGLIAVLQTWTRLLEFHPHIHFIIPGLGISLDGKRLVFPKEGFFVHVKPLSALFCKLFKEGLKKTELFNEVSPQAWQKEWVVHIKPVGDGLAALKYLMPYLFRVAISNKNIIACQNGKVTFRYKENDSGIYKQMTLPALEFMRRFLQHVLPKGFQKVRYYGFLMPKRKLLLDQIRLLLKARVMIPDNIAKKEFTFNCPTCGQKMILIKKTNRKRAPPLETIFFQTQLFPNYKLAF